MNAPPQQQQGPPAPTAEQLAITDADFQQVPLALDPSSHTLSTPVASLDLTVLNALIRSLQGLPPNVAFPPPPNAIPPQRSMAINQAKEQGNTAYRNKDWAEAVKMYTLAIDVAASRPLWEANQVARDELSLCLANRSAAFASCEDWIGALCDAEAVTKLKKPWAKGHYRKGKALVGLKRWREAREAFELGLQFDPENADLKSAVGELPKDKNQL
ncbi:hypothetical protein PHSY_002373 [Pseudozyma hubeiensis SY62]|uniref:Uncharacterized protein n=1 Tax=Pseudozyma hubeiensis (strain SY62) TaxID=1305764 RepID=R9P9Q4_PSEHS|nr:hypothetical protein PHSY_002373 [Pseudozyma hubeiensis SY62]GAC94800.1 hypothetical protein PHSY_002373 [Pseudozyma hubeiensis SY62]